MALTSFYPVLQVADPRAAAAFFTAHLGFEETFAAEWYVSLRSGTYELALLQHDHETIPADFRGRVSGILLNVEVADARAEYRRLVDEAGLPVRRDLRDEAFGQRHFIVEGPEGVLIDVIENIEPSAEFAEAYAG
ncbi:VOC family protein [Microbacterium sp. NPDC089189]|uniref:VOC family protein n=1 Tax=Microbacterium sp. NPDC089189 TaxID=3154972 RepID=UPI003424A047